MIIVDEMKNLKLYRRPMFLPTLDSDKKKKSAIFLLSPNYISSKNLMMNPLLINKKRFSSYYIEKDLTYFINSKVMQKYEGTSEGYVRNVTGFDFYDSLLEMTASERKQIPDHKFGLPSKRKYPLHDKDHILQAIKFFNYVDKKDEKELAKNLNKAINYYFDNGEKPSVGKNNRFSKYYITENIGSLKEAKDFKCMKLFFVSEKKDLKELTPRIPDNYMTKNGYEENKTPRVCFAPSVDQCLMGLSQNLKGKKFYVYTPAQWYDTFYPNANEVPDSNITGEVWIKEKVRLTCIGQIEVIGDTKEDGIIYQYGDKTAELYKWNYKWLDKVNFPNYVMEASYADNVPEDIVDFNKTLNREYDYGVVVNGKRITDMRDFDFFKNYKSLSSSEFEKYKIGVCWDYVHYEAEWFKKHGYKYETYYIQVQDEDGNCPSHTFLIFWIPESKKIYYFESSWGKYQGIEEFDNVTQLMKTIKERHIESAESKCNPNSFIKCKFDASSKSFEHIGCADYMRKASGGLVNATESTLLVESVNNKLSSFKLIDNPSKKFVEDHVDDADCIKDFLEDAVRNNSCMFLDTKTNKVAAVFMVFNDGGHHIINNLEITPEYRGRGLSKELIDFAVKKKGADHLWVGKNNKLAIKVYQDYGFKFTGDKSKQSDGTEILYMVLESCTGIQETSLKSILDKDFKKKGTKKLSSFKKISISNEAVKKYNGTSKLLRYIDPKDNGYIFVDKDDNLVAVVAVDNSRSDYNWIIAIEVFKNYQGYGLSKQLLDIATKELKGNALSVAINNEVAINLYEKYGFRISKESEEDVKAGRKKVYFMYYGAEISESSIVRRYIYDLRNDTLNGKKVDINDSDNFCPVKLANIPNYMGINLGSVHSIEWSRLPDNQLVDIVIKFIPDDGSDEVQECYICEASRADILDKTMKAFTDLGLKPNVDKSAKKKFLAGKPTDFGNSLCIAGLGAEGLSANCTKVNKIIKPLGGKVHADNYGTAFLSVKEFATFGSNLDNLHYYHAEIARPGFNYNPAMHGWDEELYYKDINSAITKPYGGSYVGNGERNKVHLYTVDLETMNPVYLGIVYVYISKDNIQDWEWGAVSDISPELLSYYVDQQRSKSYDNCPLSESVEFRQDMNSDEELYDVATIVSKMIKDSATFVIKFDDFIQTEEGMIIGTVENEYSQSLTSTLNMKIDHSIMTQYETIIRKAEDGVDYLIVRKKNLNQAVDTEEEREKIRQDTMSSLYEASFQNFDSWVSNVNVVNNPSNPYIINALILQRPDGCIFTVKDGLGRFTLPCVRIDINETSSSGNTIVDYKKPDKDRSYPSIKELMKEKLNIVPTDLQPVQNSTCITKFRDIEGKDKYGYVKYSAVKCTSYIGKYENHYPAGTTFWINPLQVPSMDIEISDLLSKILSHMEIEVRRKNVVGNTVIHPSYITCTGFANDLAVLKRLAIPEVYTDLLDALDLGNLISSTDLPRITLVADQSRRIVHRNINGVKFVEVHVDSRETRIGLQIADALHNMIVAILESVYPKCRKTLLPVMVADVIIGSTWSGVHSVTASKIVELYDLDALIALCQNGDIDSLALMTSKLSIDKEITRSYEANEFIREAKTSAITAQNLADKIKYATSTKLKRKNGVVRNKAKNLMDKIKDEIESKVKYDGLKTPTPSAPAAPSTKRVEESYYNTNSLLNEKALQFGDTVTVFEDAKYDPKLRQILYKDRMVKRKEILDLYEKVKRDVPFIAYTFPEISRYQQKNLFVDLYFYNEVFFRKNDWKLQKGFDLYFDLLDRLINDKRILQAGYQKRTVFIPVLDWDLNGATQMWMYRQSINPISIIYECMVKNPPRIKKLFKGINLVFFANDKYFKMNFDQIDDMKQASIKFRTFIRKLRANEEFDPGDIDITEKETPKAIQKNLVDKIEDAKGVDLTAKVDKVSKARDEANKKSEKRKMDTISSDPIYDELRTSDAFKKPEETPEEEEDKNISKLSKDVEKKKENSAELLALANNIDGVSRSVDSTDDALDQLDDTYMKDLLTGIEDISDDKVDINAARANRMSTLNNELLGKDIKGKTVKDILEENQKLNEKPLPVSDLRIASPNKEWEHMQYMNFGKNYDVNADIIEAFRFFSNVSRPLVIRDIEVTDNTTSEDRVALYKVSMEDYRGQRYTIKLDIPIEKNKRWLLRGGERNIQTQFCNMPIIKTDLDSCQIVSNYNKIIVSRYNTSTGRSLPMTSRFIKAANKYTKKDIKFKSGDATLICAKYDLPIDYIDLSGVFSTIETDKFIVYFNQDEIRKLYTIDETMGIPFLYEKERKKIHYINKTTMNTYNSFVTMLMYTYFSEYREFMNLYYSMKPVGRCTYSRASIMSSKIPLVVVAAYSVGLSSVLKKAGIRYHVTDKLTKDDRTNEVYDWIKFSDGYLVYTVDYASSLLLNGLKDCPTESHSITEIDDRNMYLDFLDDFGGRIKADGLDNAYDCTVDPITKRSLEFYKLPTDYIEVLLYTNLMLTDNKFIKHTDTSSRRIRREELIAAYTFRVLSESYRTYANELKHGASRVGFCCKQSAVIDKILLDPTCSDSSVMNMLGEVETTNTITTQGLSGMNSKRAYSLDKRTYDESMLNVLGMSTNFSGNVGVNRQATMNMNIEGERGYVKSIHGDTTKMNTANTLTATEALIPFSATRDDPTRVAMSFIQTSKHAMRTVESDPLLVTNGADEALPLIASDKFAFKAKKDGVIKELTESYMIIEYKDGEKEYVNLEETIEKNSDGGIYVPLKLDVAENLKQGSKVKPGTIVAYDRLSISNSLGETNNLAYNAGKLATVAIINTDEGYEDSGFITESMSKKLATKVIERMFTFVEKNTNVFNLIPVGSEVEEGDTLLVWQTPYDEKDVQALLKLMADDQESISELGRHKVKSELTGKVVGIKMYRTVELDELSDSLRKIIEKYEKPISDLKKKLKEEGIDYASLPADYPLDATGKLKNAADGVLIEFYVEYLDTVAVGDKIVYNAANKATIKSIVPDSLAPYTDSNPDEPIDAFVSVTSVAKRMVTSIPNYGALQRLMIELDKECKKIAGISLDKSQL